MKRPAFQFYPADWLNDIKLQSCSLEAQGLLINIMCLMHQSKPYGFLTINGSIPLGKDVARLLRIHHKTYHTRLKELILYGALCEDKSGCIFNKRMVKDEQLREVRIESGRMGGSPLLKQNGGQNGKQKVPPSSSSSSSSSSLKKYMSDSTEYRLAELLFLEIKKNNPKHREPNLQKWSKNIEFMLRIDKRTPEDIRQIILYAQGDDFWRSNILSTEKLREKFDRLMMKKKPFYKDAYATSLGD